MSRSPLPQAPVHDAKAKTPSIALADFGDFTEDTESLRAFQRRFRWWLPPSVGPIVASIVLAFHSPFNLRLVLSLFFFGVIAAGISIALAWRAIPVSRMSGQPMRRYYRSNAPEGVCEFIYIDTATRTYCRRVGCYYEYD